MGSWWQVEIAGRPAPIWGKSYVSDELTLLFTDDDFHLSSAKMAMLEESESSSVDPNELRASWRSELMGYTTTAGSLRRRLQLQGIETAWVCRLSTAYFDDQDEEWRDPQDQLRALFPDGKAITTALTSQTGIDVGAGIPPDGRTHPRESFLFEKWRELHEEFDDPRFALALSLSNAPDDSEVKLDLTDLVTGGWLTSVDVPHRDARLRMAAAVGADGPVIVITEGSSDARRFRRSLEISAPEVAHVFTFLDVDLRAPGGTDRVVSLTKGMAAAGVMNRVVAVLDNDTAGLDARSQLVDLQLPVQVKVICLPDVAYADDYPTIGPAGNGFQNVNGRAVSMEFMFGEEVLRDKTGALAPVRWHGYNERAADYQGRLDSAHKAEINKRIDAALSLSNQAPSAEVAEGCARLAATLIGAAHPAPRMLASEQSILSATWRQDPFADLHVPD